MKSFFENMNKHLDTDVIEEFRDVLREALDQNLQKLVARYENLSVDDVLDPLDLPDYRNHLEDQMYFNDAVRNLGAELCIMSIYRQVELHIKKIIQIYFPQINEKKYSTAKDLINTFPWVEELENYEAYNNLRKLNNSIKHDGKATRSDSRLEIDLDENYTHLAREVKTFITAFVESASKKTPARK